MKRRELQLESDRYPKTHVFIFALVVLILLASSFAYYKYRKKDIVDFQYNELSAISAEKIRNIIGWRHERLEDAAAISENFLIAELVRRFAKNPLNTVLRDEVSSIIHSIRNHFDYLDITVLDRKGNLLTSTDRGRRQIASDTLKTSLQAMSTGKVIMTDIHRGKVTPRPHIDIYVPLISRKNANSHVAGIFVLQIDPSKYFFPLVQSWPTLSKTAETLLVRKEGDHVIFINELRHKKDTALLFSIPLSETALPAVAAVLGKKGFFEGIDYEGNAVISYIGPIPGTDWFMVSKIDKDEVFEPVRAQMLYILIIIVLLITLSVTGMLLFWRQKRALYYKDKLKISEQLRFLSFRHEAILAAVPDIIAEVNKDKIYTWANPAAIEFFGTDMIGREASFYFEGEQETYSNVQPIFNGDENVIYLESWQRRKDGQKRLLAWWCRALKDDSGNVTGALSSARDITEQKSYEHQITEKTAEMERFNYTISHDLKSPLVTVKTFLGYLKDDMLNQNAERIEKDMMYIQTAAEKMGQLLDELLELTRIGRVINPPVNVMFRDIVDEALSLVAGHISKKGIEVRVQDKQLPLYGDRPRLVEIWQNLLENASKFMGEQPLPSVEIGAEQNGEEIIFFVKDNGVGINQKFKEKIFGLFEKLDPRSEGTGLGLAVVKRIVEMYEGRIWLESEGIGKGVCFWFTLPAAINKQMKGAVK